MAGFLGKMKNTGIKAKLQGECTLLDREIKARKHQFGIDLYDALRDQEKKGGILSTATGKKSSDTNHKATMGSFKSMIQEHWQVVRDDIHVLEDKQEAMQLEKTHEEVRRERGMPAITAGEKMRRASANVASAGKETKLMAQIALVDREIQKRKEKFGIDVYADAIKVVDKSPQAAATTQRTSLKSGIKSGISNVMHKGLMQVSESEQKIQQIVEFAARDVGSIERSKQTRLSEIAHLDEEGAISFRKS